MAERTLRGSRLGAVSYETDRNAELAPRKPAEYQCPKGHVFDVPFADEAEIPPVWECKFDGSVARLLDGEEPEAKKVKPARTHWDMLMERSRSCAAAAASPRNQHHTRKGRDPPGSRPFAVRPGVSARAVRSRPL